MVRVRRSRAVEPRMQVTIRRVNDDLLATQPPQGRGNRGGVLVPHVGVADQGRIGAKLFLVGVKEGRQVDATGFLFPFQQDRDRDRQLACHGFPGAAGFDKGHKLALVVSRAATDDVFRSIGAGQDLRVKGVILPQFQRVYGLHIIVPVKQDRGARRSPVVAHHHRMPRRIAHRGVKTDRGQVFGMPFRTGPRFTGIGGIGRYRLKPDGIEQARDGVVDIGVDLGQNFVEVAHGTVSSGGKGRVRKAYHHDKPTFVKVIRKARSGALGRRPQQGKTQSAAGPVPSNLQSDTRRGPSPSCCSSSTPASETRPRSPHLVP